MKAHPPTPIYYSGKNIYYISTFSFCREYPVKTHALTQDWLCVLTAMFYKLIHILAFFLPFIDNVKSDGVLGCGGFVKSDVDINFSLVEVSRRDTVPVGSNFLTS